jgi:electron transfer flavoprotein alpha subunit
MNVRIVVCVKQVPELDQIRFGRGNRIEREDVPSTINPSDLRALGHALALRAHLGGEVIALTMGPRQARAVLEDVLRRGADRALHLTDRAFAGADTLATARALARAVERLEADLVLCGRITIDGATAQLGQQLAELLGWPQVTEALQIEPAGGDATDGTDGGGSGGELPALRVTRRTETGTETWRVPVPGLLTIARGPVPETSRDLDEDPPIEELDAETLGGGPRDYGMRGSPTFVLDVRQRDLGRAGETLDGDSGIDRLTDLVGEHLAAPREQDAPPATRSQRPGQFWVLAERDDDALDPLAFEGLACASTVADHFDAEVVAVLLCADPRDHPSQLLARGADRVLVGRHPDLDDVHPGLRTAALARLLEDHDPLALVTPWTVHGRDVVPRVAARLGLGLVGDVVALEPEEDEDDPRLLWIKPAWAGTVDAPIACRMGTGIGTLRPGAVLPFTEDEDRDGPVDEVALDLDGPGEHAELESVERVLATQPAVDRAAVALLVGAATPPALLEPIRELSNQEGFGLGGTAAAVEAGDVPAQLEVSVENRSLAPPVVVAIGLEDADELAPVRGAGTIVAIAPDGDPPPALGPAVDLLVSADPTAAIESLSDLQT